MSTIDNGGPAFPLQSIGPGFAPGYAGMELRDYFAAKAMQAMISKHGIEDAPGFFDDATDESIAKCAYIYADAMLAARKEAA